MIVKITDENPFLSKLLTPIVIFALNKDNNLFGFTQEISKNYFHELASMGPNEDFLKKVIPEKVHNIEHLKGCDLTLIGIKCYAQGVGWGGTLPKVAKFIKDQDYRQPISFVWPKEIYLIDIPDNQKVVEKKMGEYDFLSRSKSYPLFEAGVPVFAFKA